MNFSEFRETCEAWFEEKPSRGHINGGVCSFIIDYVHKNREGPGQYSFKNRVIKNDDHLWWASCYCHGPLIGLDNKSISNIAFSLPEYGNHNQVWPSEACDRYYNMLLTHPLFQPLLEGSAHYRPTNQCQEYPHSWIMIPVRENTLWIMGVFAVATRWPFELYTKFKSWDYLTNELGADPWKTLIMSSAFHDYGDSNHKRWSISLGTTHGTPTDVIPKNGFMEYAEEMYKSPGQKIQMSRLAFNRLDNNQESRSRLFSLGSAGVLLREFYRNAKLGCFGEESEPETFNTRFGKARETALSVEYDTGVMYINDIVRYIHEGYDLLTNGKI